eukprot:SAG31_NODE_468_length_15250_cov_5.304138_6_plen_1372_part_00
MESLKTAKADIQGYWVDLKKLKQVLGNFFPQVDALNNATHIEANWNAFSLNSLKWIFNDHMHHSREIHTGVIHVQPIENIYLQSLDWLHSLLESKLFGLVFSECTASVNAPERLQEAASAYAGILADIESQSAKFARMRQLSPLLEIRAETEHLSRTALHMWSPWSCQEPDAMWCQSMVDVASQWNHLSSVYANLISVRKCVQLLTVFVDQLGKPDVDALFNVLERIDLLTSDFESLTLADAPALFELANQVHWCLPSLDVEIVRLVCEESRDLLDWLRSLRDDSEFSSSIEMAMGKTEMECPVELWEDGKADRPGRVNENKLSQLVAMRTFLHPLLYRDEEYFFSWKALTEVLEAVKLDRVDQRMAQNIRSSNSLLVPFTELLSDDSENAAVNRLMQLCQKDRQSRWICEHIAGYDGHESYEHALSRNLRLDYVVPRKHHVYKKTNSMSELMDFQSAIVLANTARRAEESQHQIDVFIQQFGWFRELNHNLLQLNQSGHFDFQTFRFEAFLGDDPELVRKEVVRTKQLIVNWQQNVAEQRGRYYFLNWFGMKQLWNLANFLNGTASVDDDIISNILASYAGLATPAAVADFEATLRLAWDASKTDSNILAALGRALEAGLKPLALRHRPIVIPDLDAYPAGAEIKTLHVLIVEHESQVIEQLLSAYARQGEMPEFTTTCWCTTHTSTEDVQNFFFRWSLSHRHGGAARLFCLAGVEILPYRVQQVLVGSLKDALQRSSNPLLIISIKAQFLTTNFEENRIPYVMALPSQCLQCFGRALSETYSLGMKCHKSSCSGAGKTFNILTEAATVRSRYVHVPINNDLPPADLIRRIELQIGTSGATQEKLFLHFDMTDSITVDFNSTIFSLAYLGIIADDAGQTYFWNSSSTHLAFEVSSGPLSARLTACNFLLPEVASASAETFLSSAKDLQMGMGWQFDSVLGDGTITAVSSHEAGCASAAERLQYVATALAVQQEHGGGFPYDFQSELCAKRVMSGADCLDLIVRASKTERRLSLWCLHAFVNVVYWQLQDMHMADSPLAGVTMPDALATDAETEKIVKEQIKGQLVNFVVRTAREFATRQTGKIPPLKIVGLVTSEFSNFRWNGSWKALDYVEDGHPVFQIMDGHFYLYYRKHMNNNRGGWVINDTVDASGGVFSTSDGSDLQSCGWSSTPSWQRDARYRVQMNSSVSGHNGKAVSISGAKIPADGTDGHDNGIYLLQPPYDRVHGKDHYMKPEGSSGGRRHIIWNKAENCWQVTPQCNDDAGAFALSDNANMFGEWFVMPDDIRDKCQVRIIRAADALVEKDEDATFWYSYGSIDPKCVEPEVDTSSVVSKGAQDKHALDQEFALMGCKFSAPVQPAKSLRNVYSYFVLS